jgi:hypothetical protein
MVVRHKARYRATPLASSYTVATVKGEVQASIGDYLIVDQTTGEIEAVIPKDSFFKTLEVV